MYMCVFMHALSMFMCVRAFMYVSVCAYICVWICMCVYLCFYVIKTPQNLTNRFHLLKSTKKLLLLLTSAMADILRFESLTTTPYPTAATSSRLVI